MDFKAQMFTYSYGCHGKGAIRPAVVITGACTPLEVLTKKLNDKCRLKNALWHLKIIVNGREGSIQRYRKRTI
jgi:hypothetical protein